MKKRLLLCLTGAVWLVTLLSFFPGALEHIRGKSSEKKVSYIDASRCIICTPNQERANKANKPQPNEHAHNFSCVIDEIGKGTDPVFPFVETKTIRFAALKETDIPDLHTLLTDKKTMLLSYESLHTSYRQTEQFYTTFARSYREGDTIPWGVFDKATGTLIGLAGYTEWAPDEEDATRDHPVGGRALCLLLLRSDYRKKGIATHIYKALIEYGITHKVAHMRRIETDIHEDDTYLQEEAIAAGMMQEGFLPDYYCANGSFSSFCKYAVIRSDTAEQIKQSRLLA